MADTKAKQQQQKLQIIPQKILYRLIFNLLNTKGIFFNLKKKKYFSKNGWLINFFNNRLIIKYTM